MRVLVTGAAGFLGTAVVERLLARGQVEIRCLARTAHRQSHLEALRARFPAADIEQVVGNLTCPKDAARIVDGVETIYHLAAGMRGSPADLFLNTVVGSKNLMEAAVNCKRIKMVHVSSFGVYGVAGLSRGALITEESPLDPNPELRDAYSFAKSLQERVIRDFHDRFGFDLVILRPGVIYGPGGSPFSVRVGLSLPGLFLHCGGSNRLPLTYVTNCAEAITVAGGHEGRGLQVYNVLDDDLPTSRRYLAEYKRQVGAVRSFPVPYPLICLLSAAIEKYHIASKGQLPAFITPYKAASAWKGNRFDNRRLKSIGWKQLVPTTDGMRRSFEYLRGKQTASER